ncbi:hypothetical protein SKAU_G00016510 [Synaphobranchus kaupii]|uniref:Uncharacterized protein n=1 Tax=Synaphobranchus kaupii TaxID=118154 RepID=A0A9Q1GC20_SYNKA|nr:hypothetical protein SKAU_G00016510 [Synaphobranchus kaupii]
MVSKQLDRRPTTAHYDQVQPMTVRSALLNRNTPRCRCAQQVRFKDLEEEGGVAPGRQTVPERHRLGAGPGSPHPNRKSLLGAANSSSVVGTVWGDMAATVGNVATVLAMVPPHTLTPGPARRALAPPRPLPMSVTRTHSHSLEDIIGMEGAEGRAERATPNHLPCPTTDQLYWYTHSRLPHREARSLHDEQGQSAISPPLPQLCTDSAPCPLVSIVTRSNGPTQSRRKQLGRALSDPGNKDPPHAAPPHTLPPYVAPPTAENLEKGVERGGAKQTQLPLPALPPPPPLYYSSKGGTPPTPSKVVSAQGGSEKAKWGGRIINTHNPTLNSNPAPNPALHQQPCGSCKTTDPPLTPDQARTLKQGPLSDVQGLKTRLQSLEGLLETSHSTIRLLLHVIQDLELQESQSERRMSSRSNQNMERHKSSTDNAYVIYSVENDFRLQEGIFTQSWMKADSQIPDHSSSQAISCPPPNSNSRQEEPSVLAATPLTDRPPHTCQPSHPAKKSRRKCFWFL